MPVVRRIKGRGATGWVEVHGETLFTERGDVGQWNRRFSNRISRFVSMEAPVNKRPRWSHYGKPLKRTITSSSQASPGTLKVHSAVGSTAPHAYYVDQGTGIYGGNGPYEAKVLPPWTRQSPSLYEHTFRVPRNGEWTPINPVIIKGQKGQEFFDKGLVRAFSSEGMLASAVPGNMFALRGFPEQLANFTGNTPPDAAFRAQLEEWRSWRDRAWRSDRVGYDGYVPVRFRRDAAGEIRKARESAQRKVERAKDSARRSKLYRLKQKSIKAAERAERLRRAEEQQLEKRRRSQAERERKLLKARREYLALIAAEKAELLSDATAKYRGQRVEVGGWRNHEGVYAFRLVVWRGGRRVIDTWITSNYQRPI